MLQLNNLETYRYYKGHCEYTVPKDRGPPVKLTVIGLKKNYSH